MEHVPGIDGADPTLIFKPQGNKELLRETERFEDGRIELTLQGSGGRRLTPRYASEISRGLLKSAFECAWLDHHEMVIEDRFDHIRAAVLGEPRDGFLVVMNKTNPNSQHVSLTYDFAAQDDGTWRMWAWAEYYGVCIATDSRLHAPVGDVPVDVSVLSFSKDD